MLHSRIIKHFINKQNINLTTVRCSALFINGAKASENFVYVIPHIDFPDRLKNLDLVREELQKRKANFDLNKAQNLWGVYEELKERKSEYDKIKDNISKELGQLMKNDPEGEITKKLKIQISLVKENIKKLKVPLWSAEEAAILEALELPNTLHPRTPESNNEVLFTNLSPPTTKKDHLQIGKELNLIYLKKNENYYLKGDAAIFELSAKFYFSNILKKANFVQFSNPDFVKSVIVNGCGLDHTNPDNTFILHHNENTKVNVDSRLHLTGGGSLCSFMAYYAKNVIHAKVLPLKLFTMGRQYIPSPSVEDSLFHVSQASVIQVFEATKKSEDLDTSLNELIEILKNFYSKLGYHFRICIVSADKLAMWESLRVVVEMYSSSLQNYVEVANISLSGDFISKRLMFTYVENKQNDFPHILSGTLLNVPRVIACVLEQEGNFVLPKHLNIQEWTT
ncbi:serine--tRNA synthetase-like protein Slimp [Ostrinia nubilalis]|uniref:serine--tRNA synthetase-like protein Slimp n=1 Tax=Ostrinia nubilalis TaxID=29057 RepID=UPI0030823B5C